MSGWFYMKVGILNDQPEGPLSDTAIIKLAFDGKLKTATLISHQQHTGGQWTHLEQIPQLVSKIREGEQSRAEQVKQKAEVKRQERIKADRKKREDAAEKQRQRQVDDENRQRALAVQRATQPAVRTGEVLPAMNVQHSQSTSPTVVVVGSPEQPRPNAFSQALQWGCGLYLGVTAAVAILAFGGFFLLCGGCAMLTVPIATVPHSNIQSRPVTEKQDIEVYAEVGVPIDFKTIKVTPRSISIGEALVRPLFSSDYKTEEGVLIIEFDVENVTEGQVFDLFGYATAIDEHGNESNNDDRLHFRDVTYEKGFHPGQIAHVKAFVKLKNPKAKRIVASVLCDKNNKDENANWKMLLTSP